MNENTFNFQGYAIFQSSTLDTEILSLIQIWLQLDDMNEFPLTNYSNKIRDKIRLFAAPYKIQLRGSGFDRKPDQGSFYHQQRFLKFFSMNILDSFTSLFFHTFCVRRPL